MCEQIHARLGRRRVASAIPDRIDAHVLAALRRAVKLLRHAGDVEPADGEDDRVRHGGHKTLRMTGRGGRDDDDVWLRATGAGGAAARVRASRS